MDTWNVHDPESAYAMGLEYPDQEGISSKFQDIWNFQTLIYEEDRARIEARSPAAHHLIEVIRWTHSESTAAYMTFMALRILEIHRILKPTGSLYLHCDHEANAYLRQMMDALFGASNFRNEIIWQRHTSQQRGSQHQPKKWGQTHDTILYYARTRKAPINPFRPLTDEEREKKFSRVDAQGRRYYDDSAHIWRTPNMGARPNLCYQWRGFSNPHPSGWRLSQDRLEEEYQKGNFVIYTDSKGERRLQRRMYEDNWRGTIRGSIWDDINPASGGERTGYPTQKPQELARRILEASSRPGDIVLDCFAGCAYVPVAAEQLQRRWLACDMSPRAWTIVRRQFHKQPDLHIRTEGELAEALQTRLGDDRVIHVRGPNQLPSRTDTDPTVQRSMTLKDAPVYRKRALEKDQAIWEAFVAEWGHGCWYCGKVKESRRELQLDHIAPNHRDGTNDDCWNRALACIDCNGDKGNRLTPEQTMDRALKAGRIATPALRREQANNFRARHEWTQKRWETIRPAPLL